MITTTNQTPPNPELYALQTGMRHMARTLVPRLWREIEHDYRNEDYETRNRLMIGQILKEAGIPSMSAELYASRYKDKTIGAISYTIDSLCQHFGV